MIRETKKIQEVLLAVGRSLGFIYLLWAVHFFSIILLPIIDIRDFGMIPRTPEGLVGIATMHFLHGNTTHILINSISILSVLIPLFMFFDEDNHMPQAVFKICIVGGILLWVIGRQSNHIGASLLYYGLTTYMVFGSIVHKKPSLLIYSLITVTLNSATLIGGLVPADSAVSWEGHLCGAFSGFIVALGEKRRHDLDQCCN